MHAARLVWLILGAMGVISGAIAAVAYVAGEKNAPAYLVASVLLVIVCILLWEATVLGLFQAQLVVISTERCLDILTPTGSLAESRSKALVTPAFPGVRMLRWPIRALGGKVVSVTGLLNGNPFEVKEVPTANGDTDFVAELPFVLGMFKQYELVQIVRYEDVFTEKLGRFHYFPAGFVAAASYKVLFPVGKPPTAAHVECDSGSISQDMGMAKIDVDSASGRPVATFKHRFLRGGRTYRLCWNWQVN